MFVNSLSRKNSSVFDFADNVLKSCMFFVERKNHRIFSKIDDQLKRHHRKSAADQRSPLNEFRFKNLEKRFTLVLDLDETLVHFKSEKGNSRFLLRPYVFDFIQNLSKFYEIVIFTAAQKDYADWILDKLDVKHCISLRLYREHCSMFKDCHLKDLNILNRDLSKVIIVDNVAANFTN